MPEVIQRPSARILLLDSQDRILLYRGRGPTKNPAVAWFTPGGGIDPGEAPPVAAALELREETGREVSPEDLGPVIAVSSGHWVRDDGQVFHADDAFFLLRVPEFEVDVSGMEELELSLLDTFRWWTQDELRTTGERVLPLDLAGLLDRLLTDGLPSEPIVLRWHHPELAPEELR